MRIIAVQIGSFVKLYHENVGTALHCHRNLGYSFTVARNSGALHCPADEFGGIIKLAYYGPEFGGTAPAIF